VNLYNPYEPPRDGGVPLGEMAGQSDAGAVSDRVVELMRQTRPWVIFLAILGFIGAGFMVLGGLVFVAGAAMGGTGEKGFPMAGLGVVYVVLAALYVWPSVLLLRYGMSIGKLVQEPRMEQLATSVGHQKSFWKLVGIMAAVMLALYPIIIVAAVVWGISKGGRF
jgi:hypothetical protein